MAEGDPETAITLHPDVNGVTLAMELDTGASVALISERVWKEAFSEMKLEKCDTLLKTNTGEKLRVLGQMQVQVKYNCQEQSLPLWGRNWLNAIKLNWAQIKQVTRGLQPLLKKYGDVFQQELGTLKGIEVQLVVPKDATPKFFKPRPVPYAIRGAIEKDLE